MGEKEAFGFILNTALRKTFNEMHILFIYRTSPIRLETQRVYGLQKKKKQEK